ncbi:hypothetical protein QQ045_010926 [Rhodiola kirilowii]
MYFRTLGFGQSPRHNIIREEWYRNSEEELTDSQSSSSSSRSQIVNCNICWKKADTPLVTGCGHLYCWGCLLKWVRKVSNCPMCRTRLTPDYVVPIYKN